MYESVQSLAPGKGLSNFNYEAKEYFVSGTANGRPYKTRVVVRQPVSNARFNGLVLAEPMHPSGSDHMFEFTSIYTMSSGHVAVAVVTGGLQQVIDANPQRYAGLAVGPGQPSEILAQVGALIKAKSATGPMAGLQVRKAIDAADRQAVGSDRRDGQRHRLQRFFLTLRRDDDCLEASRGGGGRHGLLVVTSGRRGAEDRCDHRRHQCQSHIFRHSAGMLVRRLMLAAIDMVVF
jgi:hypothetical protein